MGKVLIIGANGFLAKHLVIAYLNKSVQVDCVVHNNTSNLTDILPKESKIFNIDKLETIKDFYDVIFLTASYIPYHNMDKADIKLVETNMLLPYRIANKFPFTRIVYTSSVSVHVPTSHTINENSPIGTKNLYGLSKFGGEIFLKFHPNAIILRFSSLYGKGMTEKTFIPQLIRTAKEFGIVNIYGKGNRQQDYLYIKDAVQLCLMAATSDKTGAYLGVYGKSISNLDVANTIADILPNIIIQHKGEDASPSAFYNNKKAQEQLSFTPQWSIHNGLKDMINE